MYCWRSCIFPLEMPYYLWILWPMSPPCSWPSSMGSRVPEDIIAYLVNRRSPCDSHVRCSLPLEILHGHHPLLRHPSLQAHFCASFLWQTSVCMPIPVAEHFIVKYSSIYHFIPAKHGQSRSSESWYLSMEYQSMEYQSVNGVPVRTSSNKPAWPHTWSLSAPLFLIQYTDVSGTLDWYNKMVKKKKHVWGDMFILLYGQHKNQLILVYCFSYTGWCCSVFFFFF